jgi:hypothetical protein
MVERPRISFRPRWLARIPRGGRVARHSVPCPSARKGLVPSGQLRACPRPLIFNRPPPLQSKQKTDEQGTCFVGVSKANKRVHLLWLSAPRRQGATPKTNKPRQQPRCRGLHLTGDSRGLRFVVLDGGLRDLVEADSLSKAVGRDVELAVPAPGPRPAESGARHVNLDDGDVLDAPPVPSPGVGVVLRRKAPGGCATLLSLRPQSGFALAQQQPP